MTYEELISHCDRTITKYEKHDGKLPDYYQKILDEHKLTKFACEKQIPKRPDYEGDGYWNGELVYDTWICPNCGKRYEVDYDSYKYCPECGQLIDWRR